MSTELRTDDVLLAKDSLAKTVVLMKKSRALELAVVIARMAFRNPIPRIVTTNHACKFCNSHIMAQEE